MAFETLLFAREESFAVITLNRPPANAISVELVRDLNAALNSVEHDDAVRSVIITGAGDRIFCAGADLGSAFSGDDVDTFIRFGNSVMRKIERFPKPVIAAINGHALGGGCEIAMACHFRLLKDGARMGQTQIGRTPTSSSRNARNSAARSSGMSTSWMTDSERRPRSRASQRVNPQRLFQRMIFVYWREPRRFLPYRNLRTNRFCASTFFEHQNQSVSQRQR